MELELNRIEYYSVGPTLAHSMKLLPGSYKEQQRVAVGDQDGIVQLFSIKKDEPVIHFKTLPSEKIQCIQLGGAVGTISDKIFVASDNKIRAFNKKGKQFLTFDSNLTEPIRSMYVCGNDLILCGNHVYNHYRDCKDIGTYLCGDNIVDVVVLFSSATNRMVTVLACSGRVIRLLEHCRVRQSIELQSVPTVLHVPAGFNNRILCGMADGRIVLFKIEVPGNSFIEEILVKESDANAVTAIDTYDITSDGKIELIVGRRDGTVQVYTMPTDDNLFDTEIRQIFNENFSESITSAQGGCVGSNGYMEIIICTYTGRIFGLTTQCSKVSFNDAQTRTVVAMDSSGRAEKLREEIHELELKVQKERERYKMSTQSMSPGLSAILMMPVNHSMILSNVDSSYTLSIELPAPIEFVLLQSNVPIELLDVEKNTAVVSFSKCDPREGNHLLATYRCQIDKNRIDLKFRTVEGVYGTLQTFITPNVQPKVSQLQTFPIKPLSHHMCSHNVDETRPHNQLTLKGSFSHAEIHNWINMCIPEVPEKFQTVQNDKSILYFRNAFIGTELMCEYCKGEAFFKSENASTISIIKDFLTKEATKRRIKLEIQNAVNPQCMAYVIKLIEPQLLELSQTRKNFIMLNALIDLDIQNDDELASLGSDYINVLKNRDKIMLQHQTPKMFDRLIAIITELYVDFCKLKGGNMKIKVSELIAQINNYDFNRLVALMTGEVI